MSLALDEPDDIEPEEIEDIPKPIPDDPPEPYIPEPTPEESDHYARLWWAGRLG